jgi:hypothetical protein
MRAFPAQKLRRAIFASLSKLKVGALRGLGRGDARGNPRARPTAAYEAMPVEALKARHAVSAEDAEDADESEQEGERRTNVCW